MQHANTPAPGIRTTHTTVGRLTPHVNLHSKLDTRGSSIVANSRLTRDITYLGSFMTTGVGLNGQINVFKSLSPVLSQVVSWYGCFLLYKKSSQPVLSQVVSWYGCFLLYRKQSRGQFRFCNSIPIPIIAIPIQFRIRYKILKVIQFQFR